MYRDKDIIVDVNGKPIPQYWNKETQQYEPVTSHSGMLRVNMVDKDGEEIQSQDLVDQINVELKKLVEVVKNGI